MNSRFQALILYQSRASAVSLNLIRMNQLYRFDIKKQRIHLLVHEKGEPVKGYSAKILKAPTNSLSTDSPARRTCSGVANLTFRLSKEGLKVGRIPVPATTLVREGVVVFIEGTYHNPASGSIEIVWCHNFHHTTFTWGPTVFLIGPVTQGWVISAGRTVASNSSPVR